MNTLINDIKAFYADYKQADLSLLNKLYDEHVVFVDPVHQLHGREALVQYFQGGRKGLVHCSFDYSSETIDGRTACLEWSMNFAHRRLQGDNICVDGCTFITLSEDARSVVRHRDYFDVGAMLYEHLPVLGFAVKAVKRHAGGGHADG